MTQRGRHRAPGRHAKPRQSHRKVQAGFVTLGLCAAMISAQAQSTPSHLAADEPFPTSVNVQAIRDNDQSLAASPRTVSVRTVTQKVTHPIKYSVVVKRDKSLTQGRQVVRRTGSAGKAVVVYQVRSINGVEVSRSQVRRSIVVQPTPKVVAYGVAKPKPPIKVSPGSAKAFAQSYIASQYGWGDDQFGCLVQLWEKESNWNPNAHNSSSGAHGIPQALPGNKMASFGDDWWSNPETQIKWGASYIDGRYGNPCGALGHSNSTGWY